ncbi:MAG TPA: hypothetical protein VGW37_13570, partial [Terriglobia bacterium]|nr:hypothetical protein [Terriglobia bacterium]
MDRIGKVEIVTSSVASPGQPGEMLGRLRVAVVQFWLSGYGGSEKVLEAIGEIFPQADFFSLVVADGGIPASLRGRKWTT